MQLRGESGGEYAFFGKSEKNASGTESESARLESACFDLSLSDIVCVTDRKLCKEDFFERIELIAAAHPAGIVLREKDLPEAEYEIIARKTMRICEKYGVPCILHTFVSVAFKLNASAIHMPLQKLREMTFGQKNAFKHVGASCHSVEDVLEAEKAGCSYVFAGHIFNTDCKKGLPGRGLDFLRKVCEKTAIPVLAIGGINAKNIEKTRAAGAVGACVRSSFMTCENVKKLVESVKPAESVSQKSH